ncbi:MAG: hypothetical protein ACJAVM_001575 [Sulfitobacter sp.]|jgi:hypothetical protein
MLWTPSKADPKAALPRHCRLSKGDGDPPDRKGLDRGGGAFACIEPDEANDCPVFGVDFKLTHKILQLSPAICGYPH